MTTDQFSLLLIVSKKVRVWRYVYYDDLNKRTSFTILRRFTHFLDSIISIFSIWWLETNIISFGLFREQNSFNHCFHSIRIQDILDSLASVFLATHSSLVFIFNVIASKLFLFKNKSKELIHKLNIKTTSSLIVKIKACLIHELFTASRKVWQ